MRPEEVPCQRRRDVCIGQPESASSAQPSEPWNQYRVACLSSTPPTAWCGSQVSSMAGDGSAARPTPLGPTTSTGARPLGGHVHRCERAEDPPRRDGRSRPPPARSASSVPFGRPTVRAHRPHDEGPGIATPARERRSVGLRPDSSRVRRQLLAPIRVGRRGSEGRPTCRQRTNRRCPAGVDERSMTNPS